MLKKIALVLALSVQLTACAHYSVGGAGELKPGTDWVQNSESWKAEANQVFREATNYVSVQQASRPVGSWAVILDVDETILNNVQYQVERDLTGTSYSPGTWYAWTQRQEATLVPGALGFIEFVNEKGGHVALVTNRRDTEQLATENNLAALGIVRNEDFRVLLTRALPSGESDKDDRFAIVPDLLAAQGFAGVEVIAFIGDGKGDKPSTGGNWKFFCIDQGAMYGDYCADTPGPDSQLKRAKSLR